MLPIMPVKERLVASLIELLGTKKIQDISVGEISRNASTSLRNFYNYFTDKYDLMGYAYRKMVETLWWDTEGHLVSLEEFFNKCWSTADDPIKMIRFKNVMAYHGQNDHREVIEQKGVEDLQRLLKANGYPGPFDEELYNILHFIMCGIVRISELHFMDASRFPSTWLADYGIKCIPKDIAEYLLAHPREHTPGSPALQTTVTS